MTILGPEDSPMWKYKDPVDALLKDLAPVVPVRTPSSHQDVCKKFVSMQSINLVGPLLPALFTQSITQLVSFDVRDAEDSVSDFQDYEKGMGIRNMAPEIHELPIVDLPTVEQVYVFPLSLFSLFSLLPSAPRLSAFPSSPAALLLQTVDRFRDCSWKVLCAPTRHLVTHCAGRFLINPPAIPPGGYMIWKPPADFSVHGETVPTSHSPAAFPL